ncbi:MAG: hypothetical protein LBS62_10040 [Clostridiales bacterium]|nr:hypothetical protein [Clostridiales bacterium]
MLDKRDGRTLIITEKVIEKRPYHHEETGITYVCNLATNASCCYSFLEKALELNSDMTFLSEISALYRKTAEMWGGDNNTNDPGSLEILGGGFNVTSETLNDPDKRSRIIAKIRDFADVIDKVVQVLLKQKNVTDGILRSEKKFTFRSAWRLLTSENTEKIPEDVFACE